MVMTGEWFMMLFYHVLPTLPQSVCFPRREALILGDSNVADLLLDYKERRCHLLRLDDGLMDQPWEVDGDVSRMFHNEFPRRLVKKP